MQWRLKGGLACEAALSSVLLWAIFGRAVGPTAVSGFACGILVVRTHILCCSKSQLFAAEGSCAAWP